MDGQTANRNKGRVQGHTEVEERGDKGKVEGASRGYRRAQSETRKAKVVERLDFVKPDPGVRISYPKDSGEAEPLEGVENPWQSAAGEVNLRDRAGTG